MEVTFKKSEQIDGLAKALIDFQSKVEAITKNGENPHFKSKFATLDDIIDGIKKPLHEAKLAFSQMPTGDNKLITILMHETGQFMESIVDMKVEKQTSQGQGSAITYMRRYALSAMLGIASEEDDDGNAASGTEKGNVKAKTGAYFEQAKKNLVKMKDAKLVEEFKGKIAASDKYSKEEKAELSKVIDDHIKTLKKGK